MSEIRLFEVGGSIRDELMGITEIPDRDFCAESPGGWDPLLAWCHMNMKKVFLVTPEFFTIRGMMPNGTSIDVVMCRKDGESSNGRHPDHVEPGTLHDDLARRDFTINAMAREVDPKTLKPAGDIIDPFGGAQDTRNKWLQTVGDVDKRFEEDGLRILRAARFCITKDVKPCLSIKGALMNPNWWKFVTETVSTERIREELQKMFKHDTPKALRFLATDCAREALECVFNDIWLKPTMGRK